jgi:hypothetical protein
VGGGEKNRKENRNGKGVWWEKRGREKIERKN